MPFARRPEQEHAVDAVPREELEVRLERVEVECGAAVAERRQCGCDRSRHQRSFVQTLSFGPTSRSKSALNVASRAASYGAERRTLPLHVRCHSGSHHGHAVSIADRGAAWLRGSG